MPASRVTVNTWAVEDADGNKLRRRIVAVLHAGEGGGSVDGLLIAKQAEATTDPTTGIATFQLYSNDDIDQAGSFYSFTVCDVDPTVVRRYEIPAGAEVDLPDLTEVEPVGFSGYVPNPASGTAGDVLKVASDGTYELGSAIGSTPTQITGAASRRVLGRATTGTGAVEELTPAAARVLLDRGLSAALRALEPDWAFVAEGNASADLVDLIGASDGTAQGAAPYTLDPDDALTTETLLRGTFTTPVDGWFTAGYTATIRAGLLPIRELGPNQWAEILNVPVTGSGTLDYLEIAFHLNDDGTVSISDDWGTVTDGTPGAFWISDPIPGWDWRDGIAPTSIVVTASGLNGTTHTRTVTVDGDEVISEVLTGQTAYDTPTDTTDTIFVGAASGNPVLVDTAVLRDQSNAIVASFDASAPSGWTGGEGVIAGWPTAVALPSHPAGWEVDDDALFDIAADESFTVAVSTASAPEGVWTPFARNLPSALGSGAGWGIAVHEPLSVTPRAWISDGSDAVTLTSTGTWPTDAAVQTVALTLDRSDDTLSLYVDGALVDTADASTIGAITPGGAVSWFQGHGNVIAAAWWRSALSADQHAEVSTTIRTGFPAGIGAGGGGGVSLSSADPEPLGAADSGTSPLASRADHVHDLPTPADIGAATPSDITTAVNALVAAAPGALDTLDELAAALGDDANFASTVTAALAGKQASSPVLTALAANGTPGTTGLAVLLASTAAAARSTIGVNHQRTARILFSVDEPLTYSTWSPVAANVLGAGYGIGANANTESWTYEVWLDSGTHKVRSVARKHVRGPIISFSLSGGIGSIGTHDTYNGSSLGDQASTLTSSLSIATPGFYTLTMTNSTRNASNTTGWDMTPQVLTFTRTGS